MIEYKNYKQLQLAAMIAGNEFRLDRKGLPDFFAPIECDAEKPEEMAFTINGRRASYLLIGKYESTARPELCSIPLEMPACGLSFDEAVRMCLDKGIGYHMLTMAEWAALMRRSDPETLRGNLGKTIRATGQGDFGCAHNRRSSGIWDLRGNAAEWAAGYRHVDGEIQIIKQNDAAASSADELGAGSLLWRAISKTGELVEPKSQGTLKWSWNGTKAVLTTAEASPADGVYTAKLNEIVVGDDVEQGARNLLTELGILAPDGEIHFRLKGEQVACVGGDASSTCATAREIDCRYGRAEKPENVGVRIVWADMQA